MVLSIVRIIKGGWSKDNCNESIENWVQTMWMLILAKQLGFGNQIHFNFASLYLGRYLQNPVIIYWSIVGIMYLMKADSKKCFVTYGRYIMILQVITGFITGLFFVLGTIAGLLMMVRLCLYKILGLFIARDRLDAMWFFRFRIIMQRNN